MARATSIFYTAKSVRRQPTFSPLDKSRRTFLGAFLTLIILTSACAVFYIGTHVQAVNLGYKLSQELQKKEHLIEENKRLDLEIARLKSPTRIEEEAKEVFGLVLPKTQQVYYLSRWDEELNLRLAAAPSTPPTTKEPAKEAAKKPAPTEKALAKAPEKPVPAPKPEKSDKAEAIAAKPAASKAAAKPATPTQIAKAPAAKAPVETPKTLAAKAPAAKAPTETSKTLAAKPAAKPSPAAAEKSPPEVAAKAVPPIASAPGKVAKAPAAEDPQNSDVEKPDLPAKPNNGKALAQNPVKPAKSTPAKPSAETKLPKKETVLVARIVEKAPAAEKSAKPKAGPALAYQPKEKVPAVMLDPMP
ncbi:MAG TPA: cell division protein FtsL [bacterium]|nr:cell division protein FtsL [bacterium]